MFEQYAEILTVEQAAEALSMGKGSVYVLLRENKLKGFRNGRTWRVPKAAVVEYIYGVSKVNERFM